MKIAIFVPIKLNSQRLPNKMLLPLGNKLLCQHVFDMLISINEIPIDIYCYCSDKKIKNYLPNNVIFLERDKILDRDETKGIDIYNSFAEKINADIYGLVHATSPFLSKKSILEGLNKMIYDSFDSSFSCSKIQTFCWYNNKPLNYNFENVVKTQDIEPIYWETSAFYLFKKNILINEGRRIGHHPYLVLTDRIESIDIDEIEDYQLSLKCI